MKYLTILFSIILLIFSCVRPTPTKANDIFRTQVLSTLAFKGDTLKQMEILLAKLDSNNISFEKFIAHSCYELSDSVSTVVEKKFPRGMENGDKEASEYHYQLLSKAIDDYGLQFGIDKKLNDFSSMMFVVYEPIKQYCNNYRAHLEPENSIIKDSFK
jgi:hypothetical protein